MTIDQPDVTTGHGPLDAMPTWDAFVAAREGFLRAVRLQRPGAPGQAAAGEGREADGTGYRDEHRPSP